MAFLFAGAALSCFADRLHRSLTRGVCLQNDQCANSLSMFGALPYRRRLGAGTQVRHLGEPN